MRSWTVLAVICAVLGGPMHAQVSHDRAELIRLREKLNTVEAKLDGLRRYLPAEFDPVAAQERISSLASRFGPASIEVRIDPAVERVRLADGRPAPFELLRLDLSGRGSFAEIRRLLAFGFLTVHIENLRMRAEADGTVQFEGRLLFPRWIDEESPRSRSGSLDDIRASIRELEAVLHTAAALVEAGADSRSLLAALGTFMNSAEKDPIALTAVELRGAAAAPAVLRLEGYSRGTAARKRLVDGLSDASLVTESVRIESGGECDSFRVITALVPDGAGEPDALGVGITGNAIFDRASADWCSREPQPLLAPITAGTKGPGSTPMVQLRDVDLASVFFVLHDLTPEEFVVAPDVRGRVSVDLYDDATMDQIFAALAAAGAVAGPAPLRVVANRREELPPGVDVERQFSGPAVALLVHDAELADLFCVAADVLEQEVWMPPDLPRRASVFCESAPLDLLLDRLAATAGLVVHLGDGRVDIGPPPAAKLPSGRDAVEACRAGSRSGWSRLQRSTPGLAQLFSADLTVSGLARVGQDWRAYAYLPGRRLTSLMPGSELADGRVVAVGPGGVTLLVEGSRRLEVPLATPAQR